MTEADWRKHEHDVDVMSRLIVAIAVLGALIVLAGGVQQFASQGPPETRITMYAE